MGATDANKIIKAYRRELKPDFNGIPYGSLDFHRVLHPPIVGMRSKELKNADEGHAKLFD